MTFRQYRRLLIVLALPLLGIGILLAKFVYPYDGLQTFMCERRSMTEDWCRPTGELGEQLFEHIKATQPAWFDIQPSAYKEGAPYQLLFMGSRRIISNALITSVTPFAGQGPDAAAAMQKLVNRTAIVNLGIVGKETSYEIGEGGLVGLYCNSLSLENAPRNYEANCYGEGWSGPVRFTTQGADQTMLDGLKADVDAREGEQRRDYRLYQIVTYPLLLYAFLIVSAVTWLIARATRYVRAG